MHEIMRFTFSHENPNESHKNKINWPKVKTYNDLKFKKRFCIID